MHNRTTVAPALRRVSRSRSRERIREEDDQIVSNALWSSTISDSTASFQSPSTTHVTDLQRVEALQSQLTAEYNILSEALIRAENKLVAQHAAQDALKDNNTVSLKEAIKQAKRGITTAKAACTQKKREIRQAEQEMAAIRLANILSLERVNTGNTRKIDRDSLCCVFSYLNFNDWKYSQMWLVCQWWYHTLKNSRSLHVEYDLKQLASYKVKQKARKLFITSPLVHHFTHITCKVNTIDLALISSLTHIEELTLRLIPMNCKLFSLLKLTKLMKLTLFDSCTHKHLEVIKQLPSLSLFQRNYAKQPLRQSFTLNDLHTLITPPTQIAQWHLLDLAGDCNAWSQVHHVVKFKSLRFLHFGSWTDPDGKIAQLEHLEELILIPAYDEAASSLVVNYGKMIKNVPKLTLDLNEYFANIIDDFDLDDDEEEDPFELSKDEATNELKEMLSASEKLVSVQIDAAFTLTDLSCLSSLQSLRSLTLTRCWMIDAGSVRQLSVLTQLEELIIVFNFIIPSHLDYFDHFSNELAVLQVDMEGRYQQLESLRPQLTPPSSLIPSLHSYQLSQGW